jgi:IS4 transposase
MPPRIIPVLHRLRQDLSAILSKDMIEEACRQARYRWRARRLDPVTTIYLFIIQVLHGNTACRHVVHFGRWSFSDSAFCQARKRLPRAVFDRLVEKTAAAVRRASDGARWLGHRVWIVDGSSFSMPDEPELRRHFGQPGVQREGCGFPVAKWLALFDVATGMLLRSSTAPLRSHEMSRVGAISDGLEPGDVVLGDRGFCSYAHLAILLRRGLHAVFRVHQQQIVDFTPGRPQARRRGPYPRPLGLPTSRWLMAHGEDDQRVAWIKPKQRPRWMTEQDYESLPDEIGVRELRYRVEAPGYRVREITLVTTLLDMTIYSHEELARLYCKRWRIELNFRHIKISMNLEVLKCKTVDGVLKELSVFCLAYNLVRSVMTEWSRAHGVDPDRVGLVDAIRWLIGPEGGPEPVKLVVNPARRGRVEPRVVKRRPKQYVPLSKPRADLRKLLPMKYF